MENELKLKNKQTALDNAKFLLREISDIRAEALKESEGSKVKINVTIGRLAFFYEKIRNSLEYKDEHLIIKSALERILRRKFFSNFESETLAKSIVYELIGGGYLSSDSISETKIEKIASLLKRYDYLFKDILKLKRKEICSILSCAIEEVLRPAVKEKEALVNYTFKTIKENLTLDTFIDDYVLEAQLYIAIQRTLVKSDYPTIKYRLLERFVPSLNDFSVNESEIGLSLQDANRLIDEQIRSKLRPSFLKFCRKAIPPYSVLGKIIVDVEIEKIEEAIQDQEHFLQMTEGIYSKWWERASSKITKTVLRSILFIFFTKIILALILELPYELFMLKKINYLPLIINLTFPPLYMFISAFNVSVPGKDNLAIIKQWLIKIIFNTESPNYQAKFKKAGTLRSAIFSIVYLFTFILSFSAMVMILQYLKFNIVGGVLFFVFFSTVSFFAYRISENANELAMVKRGGGIIELIIDFFSIPFIKLGRFLSSNFSRLNVFLFIFDFLIETPFKTLIEFLEEWVSYAKEKKDDILND